MTASSISSPHSASSTSSHSSAARPQGRVLNSTRIVGGLFGSVNALSGVSAFSIECIGSGAIDRSILLQDSEGGLRFHERRYRQRNGRRRLRPDRHSPPRSLYVVVERADRDAVTRTFQRKLDPEATKRIAVLGPMAESSAVSRSNRSRVARPQPASAFAGNS